MKINWDKAVDRLNQMFVMQELNRILPEDLVHRTLSVIMDGDKEWHQFLKTALSDPVAYSVLFVVYIPPEEYETRSKLYQHLPPVWTHRYLCLLAKHHRKSGWESHFKALAHDFLFVLNVDLQKSLGKSGSIRKLRKNFERASIDKDGTVRIETDLWPRAKITWLSKDDKVEVHVHQLKEEGEYAFNNLVDYMMIDWMQSFEDKEIRDAPYKFEKQNKPVNCYIYKPDGQLEKGYPFRLALRDKYTGLINKMASKYPMEGEDVPYDPDGDFLDWGKTDAWRMAERAFHKSILKYTRKKGFPPGYFRMSIKSDMSDIYQKLMGSYFDPSGKPPKSLDEELRGGIPIKEVMKSEPKSHAVLENEAVESIITEFIGDEKDRIILENYGKKSDSQIADIIAKRTKIPMSKQAVQKRRTQIEPLVERAKNLRIVINEEENRKGVKSQFLTKDLDIMRFMGKKDDNQPSHGKVKNYTKKEIKKLEQTYREEKKKKP